MSSKCRCRWEWRDSMGILYGIKMMGGWVRVRDEPSCTVRKHSWHDQPIGTRDILP